MAISPQQLKTDNHYERSFIILGKGMSGKSTLGNLLLGETRFKTHSIPEAFGLTVTVESGECRVEANRIFGQEGGANEVVTIQVMEQPAMNEPRYRQEDHCEFLRKCIADCRAEMSATFLILINLNSSYFSPMEMLKLLNLAEVLSESCYSFFTNAILVFTHTDSLNQEFNREILEEILEEKLKLESFASVQDLIELVDRRYILIDLFNQSELNRYDILKKLFRLSRYSLNLYISGYNGFKGNELKSLLGEDVHNKHIERNFLKFDMKYHFNPDLNLFKRSETTPLEQITLKEFEKMGIIGKGLSVITILINLEELYNREINSLILNLPTTYNLEKDVAKKIWKYACFVFMVSDDIEDHVKNSIESNHLLKTLLSTTAGSRYTWITKRTSPEECSRRLIDLVKRVKIDLEGKTYIDTVVLAGMKQLIKRSSHLRNERNKTQVHENFIDVDIANEIPFYHLHSNNNVIVKSNEFFWDQESISFMMGYYILRSMIPDIAEKFMGLITDKGKKIPVKEFVKLFFQLFKKHKW